MVGAVWRKQHTIRRRKGIKTELATLKYDLETWYAQHLNHSKFSSSLWFCNYVSMLVLVCLALWSPYWGRGSWALCWLSACHGVHVLWFHVLIFPFGAGEGIVALPGDIFIVLLFLFCFLCVRVGSSSCSMICSISSLVPRDYLMTACSIRRVSSPTLSESATATLIHIFQLRAHWISWSTGSENMWLWRFWSIFEVFVRSKLFSKTLVLEALRQRMVLLNRSSGFVVNSAPTCTCLWNISPKIPEPRNEKICLFHMRTTKAQISLRIRAVWSAPLFFRCLDRIIPLLAIAEISRP